MPRYQVKSLSFDRIRIDGETQMRAEINTDVVDEYAGLFHDGVKMPHVVVFYDRSWYWLADGFHRWHAARKAKRDRIACEVHNGTKEDAQWYAVAANSSHGLRRTNADKRKAVTAALQHSKGAELSDRQIAEHVGVDHVTVAKYRRALEESAGENHHLPTRTGKDGKSYPAKKPPANPVNEAEGGGDDGPASEIEEDAEEFTETAVVTCPECGWPEVDEDEYGRYCHKCKAPIDEQASLGDEADGHAEEAEESEEDKLLEWIETQIRTAFTGRLAVAAARLETLAEKLRAEL